MSPSTFHAQHVSVRAEQLCNDFPEEAGGDRLAWVRVSAGQVGRAGVQEPSGRHVGSCPNQRIIPALLRNGMLYISCLPKSWDTFPFHWKPSSTRGATGGGVGERVLLAVSA